MSSDPAHEVPLHPFPAKEAAQLDEMSRESFNVRTWRDQRTNCFGSKNPRNMDSNMTLVSWNVEGLTEEKTETLKSLKHTQGWDIICMQEIWKRDSINEVDDQGFLIILSGQDATDVKNNKDPAPAWGS